MNNTQVLTYQSPKEQNFSNLTLLGFEMKGIYPEGCSPVPDCKKTFKWNNKRGYICPEHLTPATRYAIVIHYKGQRIKRTTTLDGKTLKTFADAHTLIIQAQREKQAHKFDPKKWRSKDRLEYQFNYLIWKWYEEKEKLMKQGKRAYGYVPKLKGYISNYFKPAFDGIDVREIFNVKDFVNKLPERLSAKYQKNLLDALKNFFKWLKEDRLIPDIPKFPVIEVPEYMSQTVDRDTQLKFLELVPLEHKPIFTFLIYQGARPGEVAALKGDCINGDTVCYKRTFSGRKLQEHTKTKRIRLNYIFPEVQTVLPKVFPGQYVFTHGENKRPYNNDYVNKVYRETLKTFNEKYGTDLNIPLYEFTKHSFGTQFINEYPEAEKLLQEHFGHARSDMTKKYAKLKVVNAFRRLENLKTFRKPSVTVLKS